MTARVARKRRAPLASLRGRLNGLRLRVELWLRNRAPFGYRSRKRRLFFPGCSLPSSDPDLADDIFRHLSAQDPTIGMWSACCGRPLVQFVDTASAEPFQQALMRTLRRAGIEEIVTACGNCYEELRKLTRAESGVRVLSLYELLAEHDWTIDSPVAWTIHHPCPARRDSALQDSFGRLAEKAGLQIVNSGRTPHPLPCCLVNGSGSSRRRRRLADADVLTYCAHCTRTFQRDIRTRHVLQVLFGSERAWHPGSKLRSFLHYRRLTELLRK